MGDPGDGPEVGELPHELDGEQGSGLDAESPRGGHIAEHGGNGPRDGSDKDAEPGARLERGVGEDVTAEGQQAEEAGADAEVEEGGEAEQSGEGGPGRRLPYGHAAGEVAGRRCGPSWRPLRSMIWLKPLEAPVRR